VKELGQVQPEASFNSNWRNRVVTIHDESLLTPTMPRIGNSNKDTLATLLESPELHQNVTLFIPGVSGKGKPELAKYICLLLALKYHGINNARFLMTNTLDSLRNNQSIMLSDVPVLLDDIGGDSDEDQLIYSSVSMWKAILQVKDATQNRARNACVSQKYTTPRRRSGYNQGVAICKRVCTEWNTHVPTERDEHTRSQ
jgi:hypothetical protein